MINAFYTRNAYINVTDTEDWLYAVRLYFWSNSGKDKAEAVCASEWTIISIISMLWRQTRSISNARLRNTEAAAAAVVQHRQPVIQQLYITRLADHATDKIQVSWRRLLENFKRYGYFPFSEMCCTTRYLYAKVFINHAVSRQIKTFYWTVYIRLLYTFWR